MGTEFDHFRPEAHHAFDKRSTDIKSKRRYLESIMEKNSSNSINSEWWRYILSGTGMALSNWTWPCEED